jgi:hypothetical protein
LLVRRCARTREAHAPQSKEADNVSLMLVLIHHVHLLRYYTTRGHEACIAQFVASVPPGAPVALTGSPLAAALSPGPAAQRNRPQRSGMVSRATLYSGRILSIFTRYPSGGVFVPTVLSAKVAASWHIPMMERPTLLHRVRICGRAAAYTERANARAHWSGDVAVHSGNGQDVRVGEHRRIEGILFVRSEGIMHDASSTAYTNVLYCQEMRNPPLPARSDGPVVTNLCAYGVWPHCSIHP